MLADRRNEVNQGDVVKGTDHMRDSNCGDASAVRRAPMSTCAEACQAIGSALHQIETALENMSSSAYALRAPGPFCEGSVGEHVRHVLDHVYACETGFTTGRFDYESRRRGSPVERDRLAGVAALRDARELFVRNTSALDPDHHVDTVTLLSPDANLVVLRSTIGRELAFALSHTIHHAAMIIAMARFLGQDIAYGAGQAPGTTKHRRETAACAP